MWLCSSCAHRARSAAKSSQVSSVIILHHKLSSELTFEKFDRRARLELDSESAAGKPASFAELVALDLNALAVLLPSLLVEILKSLLAAEFTIHSITIELTCEKFYQLRDTRDMDERASLEVSDFVERARRGGGGGGGGGQGVFWSCSISFGTPSVLEH